MKDVTKEYLLCKKCNHPLTLVRYFNFGRGLLEDKRAKSRDVICKKCQKIFREDRSENNFKKGVLNN